MFKDLIKSTLIGIVAKVISAFGSFLIIPLLLNQFGVENFGVWMAITSTIGLASFLDLGIGNNLMNKLSKLNALNDKPAIAECISFAYMIHFFFTLILLSAFAISFNFIDWKLLLNLKSNSYNEIIFYSFLFFLLNLFSNTIYAVQRGLQFITLANKWILINSIIYIIGIYMLLKFSPDLRLIAIATFGTPFIISVANNIFFFRSQQIKLQWNLRILTFRSAFQFSARGFIFLYLQLAGLIAFQTDSLILAHTTNYSDVAEYNIAAKLYAIPMIFLSVYFQALWPGYADSIARHDWKSIKKNFYRSLLISFVIAGSFVLGLFLFKDFLLTLWLSNASIISIELMIAFSVFTLINSVIATNLGVILNGLNMLKMQVITSFVMLVSKVLLSVYLSRIIGISGVIWGSVISSLLFSCLPLSIYLNKIFKKNS